MQLDSKCAPTREGRLAPNVVSRLEEIGKVWKHPGPMAKLGEHVVITTRNLAKGKPIYASSYPDTVGPDEASDGDFGSSWYLDEGQTAGWLELDLRKEESFNVVSLVELVGRWNDYPQSHIRSYRFQRWDGARRIALACGETPAPTTILRIPRVSSQKVRLLLEGSKEHAPYCRDWPVRRTRIGEDHAPSEIVQAQHQAGSNREPGHPLLFSLR